MITTLTSLLLLSAPTPAVEKVIVFSDRAEVTRVTRGKCTGKTQNIVFGGLPTSMDSRTLRAKATAPGQVEGFTHRVVQLEESLDHRRAKLERRADELADKMRQLHNAALGIRERSGSAESYGRYLKGILQEDLRNSKPAMPMWKKGLEFLNNEDLKGRKQLLASGVEQRTLQREIGRVQRAISVLHSSPQRQAIEVTVAMRCRGANQAALRLSYVVPGATWHPEYDVRFSAKSKSGVGKGRAQLTVSAIVQQSTGEDWENVQLILSTAKPKLGSEAPMPAPLWINGNEAGTEKVMVQGHERRERVSASGGSSGGGPKAADLDDGGKSFTLKLPHKVTVRADGRPYWMPVDEVSTKATATRVAIPKVSHYVYRTLRFENPAVYPLMAGRLNSFRNKAFMGTTHLKYTAPGAPMEVSLGIEGDFDVQREVIHKQDRKPKMFQGSRRFERHYRIRVLNHGRQGGAVEVRENMPVSKDENIRVALDRKKTTRGVMFDAHRGFVTFDVKVKPGKNRPVDFAYTISLPKDWKVQ